MTRLDSTDLSLCPHLTHGGMEQEGICWYVTVGKMLEKWVIARLQRHAPPVINY